MRVEKLRDLVARLHAQPRRRLTLLVGLDGPAGAGGAAFARALALADPGLELVRMEDFPAEAGEEGAGGTAPVDWRGLRSQVLLPLARDEPGRYRRPGYFTRGPGRWREVPVGGIVVVQGLYSCLRQLATFYDFRVWMEPAPGEALRPEEAAYVAAQDPAAAANLRVGGPGTAPHDPLLEYVRLRR